MGPPRQGSQAGAALLLTRLALTAPGAGLLLPRFFPFPFGKSTILSSHPRAGWFGLFLWNHQQKKQRFPVIVTQSIYESGYFF